MPFQIEGIYKVKGRYIYLSFSSGNGVHNIREYEFTLQVKATANHETHTGWHKLQDVVGLLLTDEDGNVLRSTIAEVGKLSPGIQ